MTSLIITIPRMPPDRITHSFGDIATATRIESIAKTISVSSTLTTVDQNGVRPSHEAAAGGVLRDSVLVLPPKWRYTRYMRYPAPTSLTQPSLMRNAARRTAPDRKANAPTMP